jgi:protein TonB
MHKARIRRPRRSHRPLPANESPRAAASPERERALTTYLAATGSRRDLKVAAFGALVAHFLLFFMVLPSTQMEPLRIEERTSATVLQRWQPPAPPSRPQRPRAVSKNRVPVPDPTPRDPEPIFDAAYETVETGDAVAEFSVGLPDAPPGPASAHGDAVAMGSDGLLSPQLLEKVVPDYTPGATRAGIQGRVWIEAVITEQGTVVEPQLIHGLPDDELNQRALDAVVLWRFEPGVRNGRPVKVIATFNIDFNIH